MDGQPLHKNEPEAERILRRLADYSLEPADVKAQRYAGRFFHRRRLGRRISAEVEGKHGTYTVSLDVGRRHLVGACSCYVGARGGCHHVRALAQTFLDDPESFSRQEALVWGHLGAPQTTTAFRAAPPPDILSTFRAQDRGDSLLTEIDEFIACCDRGDYYEPGEVGAYRAGSHLEPEIEAFGILDDFFDRVAEHRQDGGYAVAVAAYEKLFELIWRDTGRRFGFAEISGWLETDLRQAAADYLAALGHLSPPRDYVRRARRHVGSAYPDLLVTHSTSSQLAALEAALVSELERSADPADHMPYSISLLRQLYEHQGRVEEGLALCRRWRHHYPALRAPLMDHAEAVGDWSQVEALAREALEANPARALWMHDAARARLERRLSRALERQGELQEGVVHAHLAFQSQPNEEGYLWVCHLASRISPSVRARAVEDIVGFLRARHSLEEISPLRGWPSPDALLLVRILLAEGRHSEAYDLALTAKGATRARLLNTMGNFCLLANQAEALPRAAECYRRLVSLYVEARGRDNYAIAAAYAAVLREVHLRQGQSGDFDRWYAELVERHHRLRALKEELRVRLGPLARRSATLR